MMVDLHFWIARFSSSRGPVVAGVGLLVVLGIVVLGIWLQRRGWAESERRRRERRAARRD